MSHTSALQAHYLMPVPVIGRSTDTKQSVNNTHLTLLWCLTISNGAVKDTINTWKRVARAQTTY